MSVEGFIKDTNDLHFGGNDGSAQYVSNAITKKDVEIGETLLDVIAYVIPPNLTNIILVLEKGEILGVYGFGGSGPRVMQKPYLGT